MRKNFLTLVAASAFAVFGAAGVASAGVTPGVVTSDHAGIAGYYLNNNGVNRFRDAKAQFHITPIMKQLATTSAGTGAVGADLCNPNNRQAIAAAVVWNPSDNAFEFRYNSGFLVSGPLDPCVTGLGQLEPGTEFPGNVNHTTGIDPKLGDHVSVEVYYNPQTTEVTLTAKDLTNDTTSEVHVRPGAENWREAGVGVLDDNNDCLVPPVSNRVVTFDFARFTNFSATGSGVGLTGHGDLHAVSSKNPADNIVLQPTGLSGAHNSVFSVDAGVPTCV